MTRPAAQHVRAAELPELLRAFFWDYDFEALAWEDDCDLITGRVLATGDWEAVTWLRSRLGDAALRQWLEQRREPELIAPGEVRFLAHALVVPSDDPDHVRRHDTEVRGCRCLPPHGRAYGHSGVPQVGNCREENAF